MENKFFLQNSVEKIKSGRNSFFLDSKEKDFVISRLRKENIPYNVYIPYLEAEKTLIYNGKFPKMELLEILSKKKLQHRDILGVLFAHQILPYFYSDIMITEESHYVVVLEPIATYLQENIFEIGNNLVQIEKRDISTLENYHPSYDTFIFHVSSLRLDTIISKITRQSRKMVEEIIQDKEVFLNYDIVLKKDILLKEGDIFSIRGYGKYKFSKIHYQNKKGNRDIEILKYK